MHNFLNYVESSSRQKLTKASVVDDFEGFSWLEFDFLKSFLIYSQITRTHFINIYPLAHILGTCHLIFTSNFSINISCL